MPLVHLIRHAPTGETRRAEFPSSTGADPDDGGARLDEAGAVMAAALRPHLPPMAAVWSSHAARAVQTARSALREPDALHAALAEADFGTWAGRVIAHVHAEDPAGIGLWMQDPTAGPPGGEAFSVVRARAEAMLSQAARVTGGPVAMVTHGGFIRAALCAVTGAPPPSAWAFGVPSASVTVLESDDTGEHWQITAMGWRPVLPAPASDIAHGCGVGSEGTHG